MCFLDDEVKVIAEVINIVFRERRVGQTENVNARSVFYGQHVAGLDIGVDFCITLVYGRVVYGVIG